MSVTYFWRLVLLVEAIKPAFRTNHKYMYIGICILCINPADCIYTRIAA